MSNFDSAVVLAILRNRAGLTAKERAEFTSAWTKNVKMRIERWKKHRIHQTISLSQIEWAAEVVEYVNFIWKETRVHGNVKSVSKTEYKPLKEDIPLYGPKFTPPTYDDLIKRQSSPAVKPQQMYRCDLSVLHPVYWRSEEYQRCPSCGGSNTRWDGWTTTGYREVHGVWSSESAIGYQLRCGDCEKWEKDKPKQERKPHCFATTSATFWKRFEPWAIPSEIPHFLSRCAISRDLYNVIVELRLTSTASGLAENVKQWHLERYHQRRRAYYEAATDRLAHPTILEAISSTNTPPLLEFSRPDEKCGYNATPITNDSVTEVYGDFCKRTRQEESDKYMRTLTAIVISMDATFKVAKKAAVVSPEKGYETLMKGGILSMLNEVNEIISWRFCQSQSTSEITELLEGLVQRCNSLNVSPPIMAVVDNCCHVRNAMSPVLALMHIVLDVYHFKRRYMACVLNGNKNPYYTAVGKDIVDAILEKRSEKGKPAMYWPKADQVVKLKAAYEKWLRKGGVWSAAASKVHAEQLRHATKGCLARSRQDVASDGSRIEGSHKGWNSLMRSFPSGIENMRYLCHDFALRRNMRAATNRLDRAKDRPFAASGYGSHHISLMDSANRLWNNLVDSGKGRQNGRQLTRLPVLQDVDSGETFGVVSSACAATFNGLIKQEEDDDLDLLNMHLCDDDDEVSAESIMHGMHVDPALLTIPEPLPSCSTNRADSTTSNEPFTGSRASTVIDLTLHDTVEIEAGAQLLPDASKPLPMTANPFREVRTGHTRSIDDVRRSLTTREHSHFTFRATAMSANKGNTSAEWTEAKRKRSGPDPEASPEAPFHRDADNMHPTTRKRQCTVDMRIVTLREEEEESESDSDESDLEAGSSGAGGSDLQPGSGRAGGSDHQGGVIGEGAGRVTACGSQNSSTSPDGAEIISLDRRELIPPSTAPCTYGKMAANVDMPRDTAAAGGSGKASQPPSGSLHLTGIERFFNRHCSSSSSLPTANATAANRPAAIQRVPNERLDRLLRKLPALLTGERELTPSQALFSLLTELDPRALMIKGDVEFFLFMDMRAELKWASFSMNVFKWVKATAEYNQRLTASNRSRGLGTVRKHPRALMEKLEQVEKQALRRIATQDFASKSGHGGTEFWMRHCYAVQLGKDMDDAKNSGGKARKSQVCKRCKTLMYPREKGHPANHKRDYCADSAPSSSADSSRIPFPQPEGIFVKGKSFDVMPFLAAVQDLYQRVVVERVTRDDLPTETEAFASMVMDRTVEREFDGQKTVAFRLLDGVRVVGSDSVSNFTFEFNGQRFLKIGCL